MVRGGPDADGWPRLRDSIVVQRDGDELLFVLTASRTVKRFAVDGMVLRLLPLLDGRSSVEQLARLVDGDAADLAEVLALMRREKLLSRNADPTTTQALGCDRVAYYDRQLRLFQDFCDEGLTDDHDGARLQRRLERATVLICGIGGLGSWVAHCLAAAGVGTLRLCDFDVVEASNLTRQVLFAAADIGRSKVDAARDRLRAVNPQVTVMGINRRVGGAADLTDLVAGADLAIGCADQPDVVTVADWVTEACWPAIPHIIGGGYAYHIGILGVTVLPGRSACWRCVRAETRTDHGRDRAEPFIGKRPLAGATGALAGLVGSAVAWEAIRVLTGLPSAFADRWTEIDYWPMQVLTRAIPRRPHCPLCGTGRGAAEGS